jgi:hypothetical protein
MLHSSFNRRDALRASAVLLAGVAGPSSASAQTPRSPAAPVAKSTILNSQSLAPLMGAPVELGKAENGAVVNKAALDAHANTFPPRRETVKVADNIWVMQTPSVGSALIVGTDGVIVWETGDNLEDGKHYREEIHKITDKPIKAVMYSHSHEVLGTKPLLEGETDVLISRRPSRSNGLGFISISTRFCRTRGRTPNGGSRSIWANGASCQSITQ